MGDVKRHGSRRRPVDLDALARELPDHLREFPAFDSPDVARSHWADVANWLNHAAPSMGDMTPFLVAVGLDAGTFYRNAITAHTTAPLTL